MISLIFKFFRRGILSENAVIGLDNLNWYHILWSILYYIVKTKPESRYHYTLLTDHKSNAWAIISIISSIDTHTSFLSQ